MTCLTPVLQSEHYRLFRRQICADFQGGLTMEQVAARYNVPLSVVEFVIRDGLMIEGNL